MKKPVKRRIWLIVGIGVLAGILLEAVLLIAVVSSESSYPKPEKADAIVVLGAKVNPDGQPSNVLSYRLDEAARLYGEKKADKVIVCGAQGADEPKSEADVMEAELIGRGVPQEVIYKDADSYNTQQNLINAQKIMNQLSIQKAIVVTTDYHTRRALWIASDIGLDAVGSPARSSYIPFVRWRLRIQETISWIKYYLTK